MASTPQAETLPAGPSRKRTRRACDRCSSLRARCDGLHPCRRCEEYQQSCQYARHIGKRGRRPGHRKSQSSPQGSGQQGDSLEEDHELEEESSTVTHTGRTYHSPQRLSTHYLKPTSADDPSLQLTSLPGSTREIPSPSSPFSETSPYTISQVADTTLPDATGQEHNDCANFHGQASPLSANHGQIPSLPGPQKACNFKCLEPLLPKLRGIVDAELANELLNLYFVEPGGSLFRCASPYILTRVLRRESVLRSENYRQTAPALLVTMLWASAQEAESSLFLLPGQKSRVCEGLRQLMLSLIRDRDRDSWNRNTAGLLVKDSDSIRIPTNSCTDAASCGSLDPQPASSVDDVLAYVILTIVVSGGDFKKDCFRWWNKTLRLSRALGLNREDEHRDSTVAATCTKDSTCGCSVCDAYRLQISVSEVREERRRVFWLIYCLDRHLALSFNSPLNILDDECQLYCPLPDDVWESLGHPFDLDPAIANRTYGPPTTVTGIGFFEYFLPLMTILGDVIQLHRRKNHPRFGSSRLYEDYDGAMALVEDVMAECARSITEISLQYEVDTLDGTTVPASQPMTPSSRISPHGLGVLAPDQVSTTVDAAAAFPPRERPQRYRAQIQLVTAYSSFILHVLHVLLHGKWDAVSMLENKDGWITSVGFMKCASHSIAASDAVSRILACDPELAFMPYLFGIYLLHGSFILLLFADRMPQVGLNESVERACEIIIRAHEICVVTLATEFQKQFRKVLRSTLQSVRSAGGTGVEESKARQRALSLYRWSNGFTGLAV